MAMIKDGYYIAIGNKIYCKDCDYIPKGEELNNHTCPKCGGELINETYTIKEPLKSPNTADPNLEKPKKKSILDFFYKEETPTHVEVDEEGNEIIVEDEPIKNLDWFKIGATSTGLATFFGLLIWLIKKHH